MPRRYVDQQVLDLAVRKSLEYNSSSSIMYLLRERMIREIIEVATPIVTKPLVDRIKELEDRLGSTPTVEAEVVKIPKPAKLSSEKLSKLKEALDQMADAIDEN